MTLCRLIKDFCRKFATLWNNFFCNIRCQRPFCKDNTKSELDTKWNHSVFSDMHINIFCKETTGSDVCMKPGSNSKRFYKLYQTGRQDWGYEGGCQRIKEDDDDWKPTHTLNLSIPEDSAETQWEEPQFTSLQPSAQMQTPAHLCICGHLGEVRDLFVAKLKGFI